jgi:hypothetical protein
LVENCLKYQAKQTPVSIFKTSNNRISPVVRAVLFKNPNLGKPQKIKSRQQVKRKYSILMISKIK